MNTSEFLKQLEQLINRYSVENDSNTPDFILAQYLTQCLDVFARTTAARDKWWNNRSQNGLRYGEPVRGTIEPTKG